MYQHRRPNFDRADDESKPWAKTGAWFLGPKADNGDIFKEIINDVVEKHIEFRRRYGFEYILNMYRCGRKYSMSYTRLTTSINHSF